MSLAVNSRLIKRHARSRLQSVDVSFDCNAGYKVSAVIALRRVFDLTLVEAKAVFEADYMKMCAIDWAEVKEHYRSLARNRYGCSVEEQAKADEHWDAHWVEYTGPTYFALG